MEHGWSTGTAAAVRPERRPPSWRLGASLGTFPVAIGVRRHLARRVPQVSGKPSDLCAALERALRELVPEAMEVRFSCVGPTRRSRRRSWRGKGGAGARLLARGSRNRSRRRRPERRLTLLASSRRLGEELDDIGDQVESRRSLFFGVPSVPPVKTRADAHDRLLEVDVTPAERQQLPLSHSCLERNQATASYTARRGGVRRAAGAPHSRSTPLPFAPAAVSALAGVLAPDSNPRIGKSRLPAGRRSTRAGASRVLTASSRAHAGHRSTARCPRRRFGGPAGAPTSAWRGQSSSDMSRRSTACVPETRATGQPTHRIRSLARPDSPRH